MSRCVSVAGVVLFAVLLSGCIAVHVQKEESKPDRIERTAVASKMTAKKTDGVLVHLSAGADEPHRVLMALRMAEMMSEDKDVLLYCDIDAIEIVTKGAPNLQKDPFPSSDDLIDSLLQAGVPIRACPGCLAAAGKDASDLRNGVRTANKDECFAFTEGRIMTFDY